MSEKSNKNEQSQNSPRKPDTETQAKADALPVNDFDAQTEERLEQEAIDAGLRHPNRNLDKPDIDKPPYS
ncbi:hypothetical protein KBK19_00045 [Microvirga sp. STR05]|uniref:Uncharacterized protein n=1 Tax=Hymenobacter duratus TaxID=2771356 RepID=A0ABR8JD23_9BACT|nr:hypothetical protein [Hymenobacter duratus]MBD2713418.1 hypothetical protein [Hymenobacter duratus]MBR7948320.1 hypothetical protein [Microvirga sp. STR05]